MAFYSANRPNRTVTMHKEGCRHIPIANFPRCGCSSTPPNNVWIAITAPGTASCPGGVLFSHASVTTHCALVTLRPAVVEDHDAVVASACHAPHSRELLFCRQVSTDLRVEERKAPRKDVVRRGRVEPVSHA
jgi:hypothetical protein